MQAIYEKQGRSAQFATQAERDAWVHKEIKGIQKSLKSKQATLADLESQAAAAAAALDQRSQAFTPH